MDESRVEERVADEAPEAEPPTHFITSTEPDLRDLLQDRRRPDVSLDQVLNYIDLAFDSVTTALLCILYAASNLLIWSRAHQDEFREFIQREELGGETAEAQIADYLLNRDSNLEHIVNRTRRLAYANAIFWFADEELCPFSGQQAITEALRLGRVEGIAALAAKKKRLAARKSRTTAATQARVNQRREERAAEDRAKVAALAQPLVMEPPVTVTAELENLPPPGHHREMEPDARDDAEEQAGTDSDAEATPLTNIDLNRLRALPRDDRGQSLAREVKLLLARRRIPPTTEMQPRAPAWRDIAKVIRHLDQGRQM